MKGELTERQAVELHGLLVALRSELEQSLDVSTESAATVDLDQPIGRISRIDALQQQKMVQAQRTRQALRRAQVDQALQLFEDGDYGACRSCDEQIGYRRLHARPESPFCIDCQSASERR